MNVLIEKVRLVKTIKLLLTHLVHHSNSPSISIENIEIENYNIAYRSF